MSEKVVVTGGAGFIGSHLVDKLVARGYTVHVIDDLSNGKPENLNPDAVLHQLDVSDADALRRASQKIGKADRWFHLAAQIDVRISVNETARDALINVIGTINVLEAAREHKTPVVLASTGGALYGEAQPPTSEQAMIKPESPYGTAKFSAEEYLAQDARLYDIAHTVVRYANVYGPRQDPYGEGGVVAIFGGLAIEGKPARIYGDGTQTRDFVFVSDVVDATIAAADAAQDGRDQALRKDGALPRFNVGTGVETSVLDLWAAMERAVDKELGVELHPARSGELNRSALDASLAREYLGVAIDTSIDAGVQATLEWLRKG